jgi:hypothetical protein
MAMLVKDLIEALKDLPPDAEVILQKDGEGNGYSPLSGVDADAVYIAETTWAGEVYSAGWSADDAGVESDEWAEILKRPRCVVLAPVN